MDILTHSLSGVAVASVAMSYSRFRAGKKFSLLLWGGIAGALPDIDALSLWSRFDEVLGSTLGLEVSGNEIYFSKFWYSHHAFFHSVAAALLLIFVYLIIRILRTAIRNGSFKQTGSYLRANWLFPATLLGAYLIHLLEDMPTPAAVWDGVRLWWPSTEYVGGWGKIWWWNNYDLFLIVCSVILLNIMLNGFPRLRRTGSMFVMWAGIALFVWQIEHRSVDFQYQGHTDQFAKYEAQSLEEQQRILGAPLYRFMRKLDAAIPLNF